MVFSRYLPISSCAARLTRGFSIIEVLVALVILSVGLLGLAALQAEGLRGSSSAIQRTAAVNLASDIADRMRANRAALDSYVVNAATTPSTPATRCVEVVSGGTAVVPSPCTAAQMATEDLFQWKQEAGTFYDAAITSNGGNQFTITIEWQDRTLLSDAGDDLDSDDFKHIYQTQVQF